MLMIERLEDTHPELAEFIQGVALRARPYGVYKIQNGRFFRENGIKSIKKIGRNKPCPCGSGKKYKRCCGR